MEGPEHTKQTKTAEELAAMILEDLGKVDGCPAVNGLPRPSKNGGKAAFPAAPGTAAFGSRVQRSTLRTRKSGI